MSSEDNESPCKGYEDQQQNPSEDQEDDEINKLYDEWLKQEQQQTPSDTEEADEWDDEINKLYDEWLEQERENSSSISLHSPGPYNDSYNDSDPVFDPDWSPNWPSKQNCCLYHIFSNNFRVLNKTLLGYSYISEGSS
jgi:hypothetical protein